MFVRTDFSECFIKINYGEMIKLLILYDNLKNISAVLCIKELIKKLMKME
jgi:hypothetical protein